jgi:hypothetical protein
MICSADKCLFVSRGRKLDGFTDLDVTPLLLPPDSVPRMLDASGAHYQGADQQLGRRHKRSHLGSVALTAIFLVLVAPQLASRGEEGVITQDSNELGPGFTLIDRPSQASHAALLTEEVLLQQGVIDSILSTSPPGLPDAGAVRRSLKAQLSSYDRAAEFLYRDSILRVEVLGGPYRVPYSFSRSSSPVEWLTNRQDVSIPAGRHEQIAAEINTAGISQLSPGLIIYRGAQAKLYVTSYPGPALAPVLAH